MAKKSYLRHAIEDISYKYTDPQHPIGKLLQSAIKNSNPEAPALCALWAEKLLEKSKNFDAGNKYFRAVEEWHNIAHAKLEYNELPDTYIPTKEVKLAVINAKEHNRKSNFLDAILLLENLYYDDNYNHKENPFLLDTLGRAYIGNDKPDLAIDILEDYHEKHPEDIYIARTLANAYMKEEDYAPASEVLKNIIEHSTDNTWAKKMLITAGKLNREQQKKINNIQHFEHT